MHADKIRAIDGLSPDLFKRLPVQWIKNAAMSSNVFLNRYTAKWAYNYLNMFFEKMTITGTVKIIETYAL